MYRSLQLSQTNTPILHIYTDIDNFKTKMYAGKLREVAETKTIFIHHVEEEKLPRTKYENPWKSLSRNKLHFVKQLLAIADHVIWIDIDTLVFVDLEQTFQYTNSWVLGYQHGGCSGFKNCSDLPFHLQPEFDALGDLWALDRTAISEVEKTEALLSLVGRLPEYDLQGIYSIMLQSGGSSITPLHRFLPFNFGFFCYDGFAHDPELLNISMRNLALVCNEKPYVNMSMEVGAISFTGETMQEILTQDDTKLFAHIKDERARIKVRDLFLV